jgi:hypothetical protein
VIKSSRARIKAFNILLALPSEKRLIKTKIHSFIGQRPLLAFLPFGDALTSTDMLACGARLLHQLKQK